MVNKENANYPLLEEWTIAEIIQVTEFYRLVEELYQKKVDRQFFLDKYQTYLKIVPAKAAQKQLDHQFENETGCSIYRAVKFVMAQHQAKVHFNE
ncbi:UPF0223 family protein [Liquorilactobacillus nagelii]|uniref:UPF0223 family protein n=1 Tax=Liquorilactobacillus nagelii TaxID=82688 RepID=UPI001CCF87F0|nr:UPF0223 family protein [Liquorilactobacillus nagelii]ULQ48552.1 UPF0223 family protein [Liquorilactobacillus nagelii]